MFRGMTFEANGIASGYELWVVNDERSIVDEHYGLFISDNGGINLDDNGNREDKIHYNNIFAFVSNNSDTASLILGSDSILMWTVSVFIKIRMVYGLITEIPH